jgi:hypothetical protein
MPISFVAAGTVVTGANPTVTVPAGIANNDIPHHPLQYLVPH